MITKETFTDVTREHNHITLFFDFNGKKSSIGYKLNVNKNIMCVELKIIVNNRSNSTIRVNESNVDAVIKFWVKLEDIAFNVKYSFDAEGDDNIIDYLFTKR